MNDLRHYAFSGSREGMTSCQKASFEFWLSQREPGVLHHGRCYGADEQANDLARARGWKTIGHPSILKYPQSQCECDVILPAKPPLVRNFDIVQQSDEMVATPKTFEMLFRGSGTWHAIRYARKQGKRPTIIYPDGSLSPQYE